MLYGLLLIFVAFAGGESLPVVQTADGKTQGGPMTVLVMNPEKLTQRTPQ